MTSPVNPWNLEIERSADGTVVHFRGDPVVLDEINTEVVRHRLYELIDGPEGGTLALDFGNVAFLTSSTLSMLLVVRKRWQARGGRLLLTNLSPEVNDVFETTRLNTVFELA